ncbi:MAG TPA: LemA family protein [Syntrophorhabdaceae bacterium]|jgi:LemA protein|nr:LemA family protein [Syntrophorhabdaceae bacterium]HNT69631.1 LemA family protein [Syntrophorhabdaceae bacterium]
MMRKFTICAVLCLVVMGVTGCGYNTIQELDEKAKAAWGDVEAAYQRRNDLVPNLVETVKAYAKHERETLQAVTDARAKVGSVQVSKDMIGDPKTMAQFQEAQATMSSALSRLLLVVERYPDLKANQNFRDLQHQLEGTENRINVARTRFNNAVQNFNFSIRMFPYNLTNSLILHLKEKEYFKSDPGAAKAPQVKF